MTDPVILIILNVALAGFTGLLAWFLKELWGLYKEGRDHRDRMQSQIEKGSRDLLESTGLMRDMLNELRLELAKDYVPMADFKDFKEGYVRPQLHLVKERVATLEAKGLYAKPT